MCGIIGIASNKKVSTNIINALKKLEYRGYEPPLSLALYLPECHQDRIKLLIFESFSVSIKKKYFVTYYNHNSNVKRNFNEHKFKI